MNDARRNGRMRRAQNPFDDGAEERLRRMGLIRPDGEVDKTSLFALSAVYAGLLFDELCDFYQDYSMVKDDLDQLFRQQKQQRADRSFC